MPKFNAVAVVLMLLSVQSTAQNTDVDWKVMGYTKLSNEGSYIFFNAGDLHRGHDGHIEVWTKALPESALNKIWNAKKPDNDLIEKSAQKVSADYVPPYATIEKVSKDDLVFFIVMEQIADKGTIDPSARILYEIDCQGRMTRNLSTYFSFKGKTGHDEKISNWEHVAPETNASRMLKLVCLASK